MMDTRTTAHSHRANRRTAALKTIATMFTMNAMVAARLRQIKVPRPDAYAGQAGRRPELATGGMTSNEFSVADVCSAGSMPELGSELSHC